MKKIVALVLSLVMVLGLATTAFGAITLWAPNGSTAECDLYDGEYNTKLNSVPVDVKFTPAKALKLDKNGDVLQAGNIAYYKMSITGSVNDIQALIGEVFGAFGEVTLELDMTNGVATATSNNYFVKVPAVPATADASEYFFVKGHNADVPQGYQWQVAQSANDPYTILKAVDGVFYYGEAVAFADWSDDCEKYADPEWETATGAWPFYTVTKGIGSWFAEVGGFVAKLPAAAATVVDDEMNVLVAGEVVTLSAEDWVFPTAHTWAPSAWNEATGAITEYTCTNCKTVGTVINASINAPAGAKVDKLVDGTLIAYTMGAKAPAAGDKVESAQTFDAGIAMYVGMSVMAAAGSAVVLKKKD